jgi:hypothetical protein
MTQLIDAGGNALRGVNAGISLLGSALTLDNSGPFKIKNQKQCAMQLGIIAD